MNRLLYFSSEVLFPSNPKEGVLGSVEFNLFLTKVAGYPYPDIKNKFLQYLHYFYCFIAVLGFSIVYVIFELLDLFYSFNDINALANNACLSLSHVSGCFKILNVIYQLNEVVNIINSFKKLTMTYVKSEKQELTFYKAELENKVPLFLYVSIVTFTGLLGIGFLLANPAVEGNYFPFKVMLPKSIPFYGRAVCMISGVLGQAIQIVSIDYLNVTLINQLRFQLSCLNLSLQELGDPNFRKKHGIIPEKRLSDCIVHHQLILDLQKRIESIFKIPLLLQFIISLMIFALTGYQATVSKSDRMAASLVYFYCGDILTELLVFCWFGNEFIEESKKLGAVIYNSRWYNYSPRFKKIMIIFQQNTQKDLYFTSGGFARLSLQTFANILSKSYTYVALLRQVAEG
ncbi:hypothetical protein ACFFRR_004465 [Megaselia abdita]